MPIIQHRQSEDNAFVSLQIKNPLRFRNGFRSYELIFNWLSQRRIITSDLLRYFAA
jgi:hypothetical protein